MDYFELQRRLKGNANPAWVEGPARYLRRHAEGECFGDAAWFYPWGECASPERTCVDVVWVDIRLSEKDLRFQEWLAEVDRVPRAERGW